MALRHDSRTLEVNSGSDTCSHLFTEMLTHLDGSLCSCFNEHDVISEAHGCASPDDIGQHLGIEPWQSAQQACEQCRCALFEFMIGCMIKLCHYRNTVLTAVTHG